MTKEETLKLALEALTIQSDRVTEIGKQREAITAIKEALTQPEQRTWIWLSDADIRETIDSICEYSGDYDEVLCKKLERKIKEFNT